MWPLTDAKTQRLHPPMSRPVSVASGYALRRIRIVQPFYADTRTDADVHVEAILARGNFAGMTNVGGKYVVKEMVMA
jgi:hypothetical protein